MSFPIVGIEFLKHFELLVEVVSKNLIPRGSVLTGNTAGDVFAVVRQPVSSTPTYAQVLSGTASSGPAAGSTQVPFNTSAANWGKVLQDFHAVVQPFTVSSNLQHGVQHHIITSGQPVTAKFRRLDPVRLAAAKEEFSRMLAAGVIRRSSSRWASPLHMVKKKVGSWRPCGDFRRLNLVTAEDRYPLPNMADLSGRLEGCTIFTKLDLQKGYLQVPVRQGDIPKTAIITPFGLFEFLRLPFGLGNAGMMFQRMMDEVFFDMPCVFVYLDDLLVASRTAAEHQMHLRQVLHQLQATGLVINREKCVFGQPSRDFWAIRCRPTASAPWRTK
jgi:hypothetical protein